MDLGVLYVATNLRHVEEAAVSVKSLKNFHPNVSTTLYTDCVREAEGLNLFENVIELPNPEGNHKDKIQPIAESPYEYTLFLDTDTEIVASLTPLFDSLKDYEMLLGMDPWYHQVESCNPIAKQFNTGVLFYKKTDAVKNLFNEWVSDYEKLTVSWGFYPGDQFSFQRCLFSSKVRYFVFGTGYNFRTISPNLLNPQAEVRIIHGRQDNRREIAQWLNENPTVFRLFFPSMASLADAKFIFPRLWERRLFRLWAFPFVLLLKWERWRDRRKVKAKIKRGEIPAHKFNPSHKY